MYRRCCSRCLCDCIGTGHLQDDLELSYYPRQLHVLLTVDRENPMSFLQFCKGETGAAAVEFGLTAPGYFALFAGIMCCGLLLLDPTGAPAWHREGCSMCQHQLNRMWERSRNPKLRRPAGVGTQSPEFDLLGYDGIVREQSHRKLYVCLFDKLFRLAHPNAGRGVLLP